MGCVCETWSEAWVVGGGSMGGRGAGGEDLGVEESVRADRRVVFVGGDAVPVGERAAGGLDDRSERGQVVGRDADGVDRHVDGTLGDEHVLPEVAEAARAAGPLLEGDQRAGQAERIPAVVVRDAHLRLGQLGDGRHVHLAGDPVGGHVRPEAGTTPPTTVEGGRRHHAEHGAAVGMGERDQRGPHRDAADEARGAVDRVDHPTPRRILRAGHAVLLAERGVLGPCRREAIDDEPLHATIDLGHL